MTTFQARWGDVLEVARPSVHGRITGVVGLSMSAEGLLAAIGDVVTVQTAGQPILAEVVAVHRSGFACMPLGEVMGLRAGALVTSTGGPMTVAVGESLLGRVLDGLGRPMDDGKPLTNVEHVLVDANPPHPLRRDRIDPAPAGARGDGT